MATSEKKTESNRRNAQRSTGPKTDEGKEAIKHNAMKYGVYTQDVLISRGDGKEDAAELEEFTREHLETFDPVGPMERTLVMTIVVALWRLRRVRRAGVGEARLRLDSCTRDREWREEDRLHEAVAWFDESLDREPYSYAGSREQAETKHRNTLFRSSAGLRHVIGLLTDARREVDHTGRLDAHRREMIRSIFTARAPELCRVILLSDGTDEPYMPDELGNSWEDVTAPGSDREEDSEAELPVETMAPEFWRTTMLRLLRLELGRLKTELTSVREHEEMRGEAQRALFAIPNEQRAEQLSRSERALENQMYRALQELERLQQQRRDRES